MQLSFHSKLKLKLTREIYQKKKLLSSIVATYFQYLINTILQDILNMIYLNYYLLLVVVIITLSTN